MIWVAVFAATILRSFTGFGFALVAVPVLALFMPPAEVVVLSSAMAFTLSLLSVPSFSSVVNFQEMKPLLLMSLIGTALAAWTVAWIPLDLFQLCVGVSVLIACVGIVLSRPEKPIRRKSLPWLAGLLSGAMNGAIAIPGPPIIIYAMLTEFDPVRSRAMLMAFFLASSGFALLSYTAAGIVELQSVKYYLFTVPVLFVGDRLGHRLFDRYGRALYRKVAIFALAALGVSITLKALL
ncbi:sulfite exporter TauE/SafE family protein [Marinobacter alexandrii]|uniref:sulfite exporter TauE/SafE family protein n=1 Tax=Marinobacter alexandrii TaxID=2570351 RepID=UPI00329A1794